MQKSFVGQMAKSAAQFFKQSKGNKFAIIFGHDADSICSAAIIYRMLKKLHAKPQLVISDSNYSASDKTLKNVKRLRPSRIVLTDISDVSLQMMDELVGIGKVINIDHHIPKAYKNVLYINPRLADRHAYIPATYICYRIYENFFDPTDILWIAGIGTLGDHAVTNCLDLFEKIKSAYPQLVDDEKLVDEQLFDRTVIGKLTKMVDAGRVIAGSKGSLETVKILIKAKDYHEVVDNDRLRQWHQKTRDEFDRIVEDFARNKVERNGIVFYQIKSKYNLKSSVAGYMQQMFDDKILAIGQADGNMLDVSLRRGTKVKADLSELAARVVEEIPESSGGGHEAASAVRVPVKKVRQLLNILAT